MVVKHNQRTIEGESWTRANRIVIENPNDAIPSVTFVQEMMIEMGGITVSKPIENMYVNFTPDVMTEQFPLINPVTGELTGATISYAEIYAILFSAYEHAIQKKNTPVEAPEGDWDEDPGVPPPADGGEEEAPEPPVEGDAEPVEDA